MTLDLFTPRPWEALALAAAALAAVLWALARRRWPKLDRPSLPWGLDVALVALAAGLHAGPILGMWRSLAPYGSPVGPDADVTFLSAVALETGNLDLYSSDRYPAFPWASSALADSVADLPAAGLHLSMAAAALAGLAAYGLARQLGGRAAGFLAMCLVLRLPGLVDAGRQFTPYAAIGALDLLGVWGLVALARGAPWGAALVTMAVPGLFASDPKQLPVALLFVGIGAVLSLATRRRTGVVAAAALLAVIPATNAVLARAALPVESVEWITARVPLGFKVDPALPLQGWTPGAPLSALFTTLSRVSAAVSVDAGRGWMEPGAALGITMELPQTSLVWALGVPLLLVAALLRKQGRDALALVAVAPLAPVLLSAVHLHFQHRYFLPLALVLPPLVAAALARVGGPAAVAGATLVVLLSPSSPWSREAPGLSGPSSRQTDSWAGAEAPDWSVTVSGLLTSLPDDAFVLDYAASRPWAMLPLVRPYLRCTWTEDSCRSHLRDPGHLYAVLFPGEGPTVNDAPRAETLTSGGGFPPDVVGDCWTRVWPRPGNGALYAWTCDVRPASWREGPPPPPKTP